jgi:hypothetical protein
MAVHGIGIKDHKPIYDDRVRIAVIEAMNLRYFFHDESCLESGLVF